MTAPLEGIRVVDFSRVLAGPHCTRVLSDLGAEVIKLEPPAGDLTRFASPRVNGLSTYFVQQNAGKRNISVDLSTPQGQELAADGAGQRAVDLCPAARAVGASRTASRGVAARRPAVRTLCSLRAHVPQFTSRLT